MSGRGSPRSSPYSSHLLDLAALDGEHLDEKRVYVLTEDSKVRIFTAEGKELGAVPVAAGVTAIDIAPRGEMLYLLNTRDNRYTAMNISINQTIDVTGAPVRGKLDAPVTH